MQCWMGGRFRPGEPFNVAADLDDVLAEQLNDERSSPRFVRVQQPTEPSLADEAVVMPGVDARGHDLFQVAQPGDKARGRLGVVDPVRITTGSPATTRPGQVRERLSVTDLAGAQGVPGSDAAMSVTTGASRAGKAWVKLSLTQGW